MGSAPTGFDVLAQAAPAAAAQQRQIAEQQRVERQNTVGAQLLDAINNASNIKPTTKDPTTGEEIPNPAYSQAQKDKQNLITQYMGLNSPQQHTDFSQRIHGLIFGNPTPHAQQPALSPNSSPVAPPAPPTGAAPGQPAPSPAAAPPPHPMAPVSADHPLNAITRGISALGNHLKAFASPAKPTTPPVDAAAIARQYQDPAQVAFERQKELWGVRGENALAVQQLKVQALMASIQMRPPRLLSQTTIPDLLEQIKVDPTTTIVGPDGEVIPPEKLAAMPPGTIAREFRAGSQIFYALGDQTSKTLNVGGHVYDIPSVGAINAGNVTDLGQATSTLPHASSNKSTDAFGTTTTSNTTRQTVVPPGASALTGAAPASGIAAPVSSAAPVVPSATTQPVNPGARAPGTKPTGSAIKSKPISAVAPSAPSSAPPAPLDADGHIPAGTGNDLVRQFANDLLDGKDVKDIPNPRARAAAEAMARPYGWEQGKFTPRDLGQVQVFQTQLDKLTDPKTGFLSVYDEGPIKRGLIAKFLDTQTQRQPPNEFITALQSGLLNDRDENFITMFNQAVGRIQALSQLTRGSGTRNTEAAVNRMMKELPYPNRVHSSAEAAQALQSIQEEINTAMTKKEWGGGGPVSANAPKSPSAAPSLVDQLHAALKGK